jgi:hypothetical protein
LSGIARFQNQPSPHCLQIAVQSVEAGQHESHPRRSGFRVVEQGAIEDKHGNHLPAPCSPIEGLMIGDAQIATKPNNRAAHIPTVEALCPCWGLAMEAITLPPSP